MRSARLHSAKLLAVLVAAWSCAIPCLAQPPAAPAYQRSRPGAHDWHARGGQHQNWRGGPGGYFDPGFGYGGFYGYTPPFIAGTWYERPYPYHFDYYRYRWGGGHLPSEAATECDCREGPPSGAEGAAHVDGHWSDVSIQFPATRPLD